MFKLYNKMFIKAFFIQSLWNFERLQNIGFLFVMKSFLKHLYKDKAKLKEAYLRHLGFFNTHPYMANIILAMAANMEEKIAAEEANPQDVNILKNAMAGPLAAIGDSFFWGTIRPVVSFISIFMVILFARVLDPALAEYSVFVPLFFIFTYNLIHIPIRYWFMVVGFRFDSETIQFISKMEFKFLWEAIRYAGILVVAAAVFFYFKVFGFAPGNTNFFQGFIPDAMVYAIVFLLSFLLGKIRPVFLFYSVIVFCILISYLGI